MKGRKLTLDEVIELKDGTKVWVECSKEDIREIGIVKKRDDVCIVEDSEGWFCIDDMIENKRTHLYVSFYEWIEESYSNHMMLFDEDNCEYNIISMATEICNLRGIDLTEDNIRLIVEEFS